MKTHDGSSVNIVDANAIMLQRREEEPAMVMMVWLCNNSVLAVLEASFTAGS